MGGRSMQKMKTMAITVSVLFFALAHPATPEDVIPEDFSLPEVVGGNSPNDDTASAEAIEGRADQVVPEEELPQSAANRRDLVKQIKHCEDCINTMLEGIAQAYRECAERTEAKCEEGLDSHDGRDVVALIESEAAKATTYDVALYPEAKAAADEQKTEFDGKFGQIKARFESCANDKAQCSVSEFNRDITHLLRLTRRIPWRTTAFCRQISAGSAVDAETGDMQGRELLGGFGLIGLGVLDFRDAQEQHPAGF